MCNYSIVNLKLLERIIIKKKQFRKSEVEKMIIFIISSILQTFIHNFNR